MAFRGGEIEHAHETNRRIRSRFRSVAEVVCSNQMPVDLDAVAKATVRALELKACVFQQPHPVGGFEVLGLSSNEEVVPSWIERIASKFAGDVASSRNPLLISAIPEQYPHDRLLNGPQLGDYAGVPILDADGELVLVASMISSAARNLTEEDVCLLRVVAKFASDSVAFQALESKVRDLEVVLSPTSPNSKLENLDTGDSFKLSVLVIDDDLAVNDLICEFLLLEGYRVEAAYDGLEAVRMFRPADHDVVLTDVAMPHMNGWELIAALRVRAPEVPVVLITGYSSGTWNQSFLREHGVVEVLSKPLDMARLVSILQRFHHTKVRLTQEYAF